MNNKNYDNNFYEIEKHFVNIFNNKTKYELYNLNINDPEDYYKYNINSILDIKDIKNLLRALRLIFPNTNSDNIYSRFILVKHILSSLTKNDYNEYNEFQFELRKMLWFCIEILERNERLYTNDFENNDEKVIFSFNIKYIKYKKD